MCISWGVSAYIQPTSALPCKPWLVPVHAARIRVPPRRVGHAGAPHGAEHAVLVLVQTGDLTSSVPLRPVYVADCLTASGAAIRGPDVVFTAGTQRERERERRERMRERERTGEIELPEHPYT